MGKTESDLIPFFERGLKSQKYGLYLEYFEQKNNIFRLSLPRLTNKICSEPIQILKDWYSEKNRENFCYSKAKQAMLAALRKSVYLEHVPNERYPLIYRILKPEEVKEKRKKVKEKRNNEMEVKPRKSLDYDSPSSVESGYSSIGDDENEIMNEFLSSVDVLLQEKVTSFMSTEDCNQYTNNSFLSNALESDFEFKNFEIPDHELKVCLDDLAEDLPTLDDFNCEDSRNKTKVYKYKEAIRVEENILMMILESEEKDIYKEGSNSNITLILDTDVLQKCQAYELINSIFVGNYLQIFLKFPETGNH